MNTIIETQKLTKTYGQTQALDQITLSLPPNKIYGLLGRNGAGKTTLMSILTAQAFATSGTIKVCGESPVENSEVLSQLCFIRENQKYPDEATPTSVFKSVPWFFPNWSEDVAEQLIKDFEIPLKTQMKKLSRGQFSAVGVTIGLASRAPVTFFDEPYLGLDAVAREIFYQRLATDYAESPRTVILSSHLIDEIANLVEHVLLLDKGKLIVNSDMAELQEKAFQITGPTAIVESFVTTKKVLRRETLGGISRLTILDSLDAEDLHQAQIQNLQIEPASLQEVAVGLADSSLK